MLHCAYSPYSAPPPPPQPSPIYSKFLTGIPYLQQYTHCSYKTQLKEQNFVSNNITFSKKHTYQCSVHLEYDVMMTVDDTKTPIKKHIDNRLKYSNIKLSKILKRKALQIFKTQSPCCHLHINNLNKLVL